MRFELTTSSLPRKCSTPELQQQNRCSPGRTTLQPLRGSCEEPSTHNEHRAADEIRTRDIQLGRLTLYQLSYHRNWVNVWGWWDSNLLSGKAPDLQSGPALQLRGTPLTT